MVSHQFIIFLYVALGVVSNNMVESKYCPIEIDGDVKYYICPRHEICCTFGCCISSNFHFYQLWYYWLMVILMFLLCSGGTWWYRYWLQEGHYPPAPQPTHRPPPLHNRPPCPSVTYHRGRPGRVVVQHTWKHNRSAVAGYPTPPPSYRYVQRHQSLTDLLDESTEVEVVNNPSGLVPEPKSSPYYQLYGPPPSYDSVVTQTLTEQRQNIHRHHNLQTFNSIDSLCENENSAQSACTHNQNDEDCQENINKAQNSNASVQLQHERLPQGSHRSSTSRSTSTQSTSRSHQNTQLDGVSM